MVSWFQLNRPLVRAGVSVLAAMVLSTAALAADEGVGDEFDGDVVVDDSGSDGEIVYEDESWIMDEDLLNAGGGGGFDADSSGEDPEYLEMVSDCGGCEMQTLGGMDGQPEFYGAAADLKGERAAFVPGPDVCELPGSIGWLCDWQKGASGQ